MGTARKKRSWHQKGKGNLAPEEGGARLRSDSVATGRRSPLFWCSDVLSSDVFEQRTAAFFYIFALWKKQSSQQAVSGACSITWPGYRVSLKVQWVRSEERRVG